MPVFRVTVSGIQYGQITIQNVLHFSWTDFVGTDLTVAQEVRDGWCTILAAAQVSSYGVRNISVFRVGSNASPTNLPVVINGADLGDPNNSMPVMAAKLRIHTGFAGRHGRGRVYVAGVRQAHWQFGQMTAAGITVWNARAAALKARYIGPNQTGPMNLGVLSRTGNEADFHLADDLALSVIPGIQRRRNLGVGI